MSEPTVHQLYKRLETIGRGAFGSVHRGVHIPTGQIVALKIINLDTADDDVDDIQREVALLTQLRDGVNVTRYFGCYLDGARVWIAMEYAEGGSVRTLMKASPNPSGALEERFIAVIVREALAALSYLHHSGIIHRDIKAANILVTSSGRVMLCDFGVSALLPTASSKRYSLAGTPYWMSPEVAQPIPAYDTKADIWSLGITIFEMATGSPPHAELDKFKVIKLIPKAKPPQLLESEGSKEMRDFVACCLKELPADVRAHILLTAISNCSHMQRLTADELAKTKWVKSVAKAPLSVLTELLHRYDSWVQAGGSRASLADPIPWEHEEEEE